MFSNLVLLACVIVISASLGAIAFRFLMQWAAKFEVVVDPIAAINTRLRDIEVELINIERLQRSNPAESRQHDGKYSALILERRKLEYRLKNLSESETVAA